MHFSRFCLLLEFQGAENNYSLFKNDFNNIYRLNFTKLALYADYNQWDLQSVKSSKLNS